MATKIFSSRADEDSLAYADSLARREYGLSFGQYCGTVLLDAIGRMGRMPDLADDEGRPERIEAAAFMKSFASRARRPEVGRLSDEQVKALIASRYDA